MQMSHNENVVLKPSRLYSHICSYPLLLLTALLLPLLSCQPEEDHKYEELPEDERHLPENALAGMEVTEGLEVKLFASEDNVVNATNLDIDERGRIWVTEGVNYRMSRNPQMEHTVREEGDRIVILEDTDGDGSADSHTVFYQGHDINAALGIMVIHPDENLHRQVIVSNSPNVYLFTDTTGNDQADTKELLFTGIGGEDHDHGVHAFVFGPDGKYYFNFGDQGREIRDSEGNLIIDKAGNEVKEGENYRKGMVFRMNPDGSEFEVLAHNFRNNYEVTLDSFGTLWQSDNDDDGNRSVRINYVMEYGNYGYTDEITGAGWRNRRVNQEETVHERHWHQNDPGVVPNLLDTGSGSPTGMMVYEGDLLPPVFHNQMIHTEPGHNVVRAYPVERAGAGYTATIENIFQAVNRQWFRPVDVTAAPDGSLFVADWYDPGVGGHRVADSHSGRIYRIAPENTPYRIPEYDFDSPAGAVEALKSPNLVIRSHAWTQLNSWGERAESSLESLWNSSVNSRYRARALWLLAKIDGKSEEYIQQAIRDGDPDIRITGLRAARQSEAELISYIDHLADDPSPAVRREAVLALRHDDSPDAPRLWTKLAMQYDGEDRWYLEALGIGADRQWDSFFDAWLDLSAENRNTPAGRDIVWRSRSEKALPILDEMIRDPEVAMGEKARYFRSFHFHDSPDKEHILVNLLNDYYQQDQKEIATFALQLLEPSVTEEFPEVKTALETVLDEIRGTADYLDLVQRYQAGSQADGLVQLMVMHPDSSLGIEAGQFLLNSGEDSLASLFYSREVEDIENIMRVLGRISTPDAIDLLQVAVDDRTINLETRQKAVEAFGMSRGQGRSTAEDRLFEMIHDGRIPAALELTARNILINSSREEVRDEIAGLIGSSGNRSEDTFRPVSDLILEEGNVQAGRQLFIQSCQVCHQVRGAGTVFGPDLSEIGTKLPKESLFNKLMNPDAGINFGYEGYILTMEDGSNIMGIIESETESETVLRLPGGYMNRLDSTRIETRERMEQSLMPSATNLQMTNENLIDLVEYLATLQRE